MGPAPPSPDTTPDWAVLLGRYLKRHIAVYGVVVACALLLSFVAPADRGLFIPLLLWGVLVLAHFLTVRAITVDPDWVEERSETITMNASDLSHIEDIRERMEQGKSESGRLITKKPNEGTD